MKRKAWQAWDRCVVCGSPMVEWHHIFYGTANRRMSDEYGYILPLCREHHTGATGIHFNKDLDMYWKRRAEVHFLGNYGSRGDFIRTFGKNYLEE